MNKTAILFLAIMLVVFGCSAPGSISPVASVSPPQVSVPPSQYTLIVNVQPPYAGYCAPTGGQYSPGTEVTVTAYPATGYELDYWDGDESGTGLGIRLKMDGHKRLTAHFRLEQPRTSAPATTQPVVTVIRSSTPTPTGPPTNASSLVRYLQTKYGLVKTSMGDLRLKFEVVQNDAITMPYDYWIQMYDSQFFYDLKYSKNVSNELNAKVCLELQDLEEQVAKDLTATMPGKKFYGNYYVSGYEYPNIRAGFWAHRYYSWVNYAPQSVTTSYDQAAVSEFTWWPLIDDKLTR